MPRACDCHCLWYKRRVSTIDPTTAPESIREWLADAREVVDAELDTLLKLPELPESDPVYRLADAMRTWSELWQELAGTPRRKPGSIPD